MAAAPTGSSLFRQLVVPVAGIVLAAVLANVGFAAFLAARRSLEAARAAERQVTRAIESARVPLVPPVLAALHALTGSHFVVRDATTGVAGATTLPARTEARLDAAALAAAVGGVTVVDGRRYRVGTARAGGPRPESVLVLTPLRDGLATTLEAVWPVLAVAAATLAVLVPLGLFTTSRLAGRITAVERHVGRIARGEFGQVLPAAPDVPDDEVTRLAAGVDRMSLELAALRDRLVAGERQRLLGQLAAGFAHELRNAVTGARLAIELHARRCAGGAADDGLAVAIRQLGIVEEEVRGLLALGGPARAAPAAPAAVDLAGLCAEVGDLVGPRCAHGGVRLAIAAPPGLAIAGRRDGLRAALVNLALNGIDAAGRGGHVTLTAGTDADAVTLAVEDDGPGPPAALAGTLAEPFVTGKPEGIGLGLAVARAVAEDHGGRLEWRRVADRTRFALVLPAGGPQAGEQRG